MTVVPIEHLPSVTPGFPLRTKERNDPYWTSIWRAGSSGDWYSAQQYRELRDIGYAKAPKWLEMTEEDARRRLLLPRNREPIMTVLAVLDQWRTATVQQVRAMTHLLDFTEGSVSLLSVMWNAGLIEICELGGAAFGTGVRDRDGLLLRPARPGEALREFCASLSYVEWVSMTAGLPMDADRQFSRHNVLATEFGLRVAEHSPAAMVLGEKLSTTDLLAYSGLGLPAPAGVHGSSDLTIIRDDGLRIAVELTASLAGGATGFFNKVQRLVTLLSRKPLADSGLCYLIVVAPRRDGNVTDQEAVRTVKRAVQKAVDAFPGTYTDPTAARVGVTSWVDLFPGDRQAVSDFWRLPIERPAGRDYVGDPDDDKAWSKGFFLDKTSTPFEPSDPVWMKAVIGNARGLRGIPHHLRKDEGRPHLNDISMRRLGFTRALQVERTMSLTGARGVTGERKLPARLVY